MQEYCRSIVGDAKGSTVLVSTDSAVSAIDTAGPTLLWTHDISDRFLSGAVVSAIHGKAVYRDGVGMVCRDLASGNLAWRIDTEEGRFTSISLSPSDGTLVLTSAEFGVMWRRLEDGAICDSQRDLYEVGCDQDGAMRLEQDLDNQFFLNRHGARHELPLDTFGILDFSFAPEVLVVLLPLGLVQAFCVHSRELLWEAGGPGAYYEALAFHEEIGSFVGYRCVEGDGSIQESSIELIGTKDGKRNPTYTFAIAPVPLAFFDFGRKAITNRGELVDVESGEETQVFEGLIPSLGPIPRKRYLP